MVLFSLLNGSLESLLIYLKITGSWPMYQGGSLDPYIYQIKIARFGGATIPGCIPVLDVAIRASNRFLVEILF